MMKTFKEEEYTVHVCTDILEWVNEFYDVPPGAIPANEENECLGFAAIARPISDGRMAGNTIWIYVPEKYLDTDLKATVAHEIGHIVEMEYPKNPDQSEENDELHEAKADHYMNYYLLVYRIIAGVLKKL